VENYHVSYQSWYRGTHQLKKRSSDGVSVCPASTQKEAEGGKRQIRRSQENNSVSSGAYWDEYSEASESGRERHKEPKHSRRTTAWARKESHARSISAHPSDNEEDFVQETPEAVLVAAHAYLLTTQLEPEDPRGHMHQDAIRSLRLVEDRLRKHSPEKKATYYEDKGKENFKYQPSQSQTSDQRSCGRKKMSSEEVKKTIVFQVEHTGTNTTKHRTPAERDIESQSTIGGQQHEQGKRIAPEA
jgi:hypothetical protein